MAKTKAHKKKKFKQLANRRVNKLLHQLRLIGNLNNEYAYQFEPEQIDKIFETIQERIQLTKSIFESSKINKFQI